MKRKTKLFFIVSAFFMICNFGCKKAEEATTTESVEDDLSNIVDTTVSNATSQANAIVYSGMLLNHEGFESQIAHPLSSCTVASARSACSSNSITVNWNSCTMGNSSLSATVTGIITETYSGFGAALCMMNGNNSVLTRKVDDSNPRTVTFSAPAALSGAKIVSKMNPDTAYDGTVFSQSATGTVISRIESGTSNSLTCGVGSPCFNIVVNGVQNTMTGPRGTKWFDHIMTSDLTAQGTRSGENLVMNGSSTVWHQVAQYKAVNTFDSVTWGDSTCCYPTSGTITSTVTGALTGSAITTFSTTCGEVSFVGTEGGAPQTVTFKQCQP